MNILIIGSGAREAFIIKKIYDDDILNEVTVSCIGTNHNPDILKICKFNYIIDQFNLENIKLIHCNQTNYLQYDFVIVGPEAPLKEGISDYFENLNMSTLGPLEVYSRIETSKIYCRQFLDANKLNAYSPKYQIIYHNHNFFKQKTNDDRINYIKESLKNFEQIVLKRDGLHGGKGVKVQGVDFENKEQVIDEILDICLNEDLLIEEKLIGEEFSLMSISDGYGNIRHFPPIQDYKRLNNNDLGPNTGSMGCIIDKNNTLPFLDESDLNICKNINCNVITNLNDNTKKIGYRGILYGSYLKTSDGKIYIIEFNSRFGDPECILALKKLNTNFVDICKQTSFGKLSSDLEFNNKAMIGIYLVPKNYPSKDNDKYDIYIDKDVVNKDNIVLGNVEESDEHLYSLNSRSIFYYTEGDKLYNCYNQIYKQVKGITGNLHYRTDIGSKFLSKYEQVGVSITNGDIAVKKIKKSIEATYGDTVLGKHGDFGGQVRFKDQILVSSIDGVGTKSILAQRSRGLDSFINLGKDIVNHSINDILVQGAYPLFFMDYFGTSSLNIQELCNFIEGASQACIENDRMPLLGGETAEMPSIYKDNQTDLVGCIVGYKNLNFFQKEIISGDILIGLPSVGPHTNGFSLINTLKNIPDHIIDQLLNPHKSYLNDVNNFVKDHGYDSLHGMCHITGGGLIANLERIIPKNLELVLKNDLELPEWCQYIKDNGNVSIEELYKVYNCGIGYVLIIDSDTFLKLKKLEYVKIGEII
jgi:phosphoribosylamine--glycine ligase / phosphoribosylformylglycinamidine cyclo-ligase